MMLSNQREDGVFNQIPVNGLLTKDIKLDEAAFHARIHVFLEHGLEGAEDIGESQLCVGDVLL